MKSLLKRLFATLIVATIILGATAVTAFADPSSEPLPPIVPPRCDVIGPK